MIKIIKNTLLVIAVLSFLVALGIIGNVDNGGELNELLWTIPWFALSVISGFLGLI